MLAWMVFLKILEFVAFEVFKPKKDKSEDALKVHR